MSKNLVLVLVQVESYSILSVVEANKIVSFIFELICFSFDLDLVNKVATYLYFHIIIHSMMSHSNKVVT